MPTTLLQDARVLATVKPFGTRIHSRYHRLSALVLANYDRMNYNRRHGNLFVDGYNRFAAEMEQTLLDLPTRRPKMVDFVKALPDPWMMVGFRKEELDEGFLKLWDRFTVPERSDVLGLLHSPLPARLDELMSWAKKGRFSNYPDFFDGNGIDTPSNWPNTLGFNVSQSEWLWGNRDRYSVTEDDLYVLMDAGVQYPVPLGRHKSLQDCVAEVQRTFTPERRVLGRLPFRYPALSDEESARYPSAAAFFAQTVHSDWVVDGLVDVAQFDAVLQGAEGLSLNSMRERLAYNLAEPSDIYGGFLSSLNLAVWGKVQELSTWPERHFDAVWNVSADPAEVEEVLGWMSPHVRGTHSPTHSWLEWVMLPADAPDELWSSTFFAPGDLPKFLCAIRAGVSWDELHHLVSGEGLSVAEVWEVVLNGIPVEYVKAMRGS